MNRADGAGTEALEGSEMRILTALGLMALTVLTSGPAVAADSDLRQLSTGDDVRAYRAVGRLEIAGQGFCTATLIDTRLVLTAAHCVTDAGGQRIAPEHLVFRAGLRDGRADAERGARRVVVDRSYLHGSGGPASLAADIALIELDRPVDPHIVAPIPASVAAGVRIGVISYAHDRAERPSLQEECRILGHEAGAIVMSCDVDFGSSGAPVLRLDGAAPRIVSVVSAKARADGRKVSLGADVAKALPALRAELTASNGVFWRSADSGARPQTGAKFLRP